MSSCFLVTFPENNHDSKNKQCYPFLHPRNILCDDLAYFAPFTCHLKRELFHCIQFKAHFFFFQLKFSFHSFIVFLYCFHFDLIDLCLLKIPLPTFSGFPSKQYKCIFFLHIIVTQKSSSGTFYYLSFSSIYVDTIKKWMCIYTYKIV